MASIFRIGVGRLIRQGGVILLLLMLSACSKNHGHETATEKLKGDFDKARATAMVNYGIKTVKGNTNITEIDCLVFNQAAGRVTGTIPPPTTLGDWSALTDSMRVRMAAGCVDPLLALTDYETARRGLAAAWTTAMGALPGSSRIEAEQGDMGNFVTGQLDLVVTERAVCIAQTGARARVRRLTGQTMESAIRNCNMHPLVTGWAAECTDAWSTVAALDAALGARTENVWVAELVERYKMALMACSPSATQEYVNFHQAMPPALFQGPVFRLAIPIDPLTACTIDAVTHAKSNPYATIDTRSNMNHCASILGFNGIFNSDFIPTVIDPKLLKADGDRWLFDPTKAAGNPSLWTFNACEVNLINHLRQAGLNPISPKVVHQRCQEHPNG